MPEIPNIGDSQTISGAGLPKAAHVMEIHVPPYSKEPFGCDTRIAGTRAVDVDNSEIESFFQFASMKIIICGIFMHVCFSCMKSIFNGHGVPPSTLGLLYRAVENDCDLMKCSS